MTDRKAAYLQADEELRKLGRGKNPTAAALTAQAATTQQLVRDYWFDVWRAVLAGQADKRRTIVSLAKVFDVQAEDILSAHDKEVPLWVVGPDA
jgi:hypothetical protein